MKKPSEEILLMATAIAARNARAVGLPEPAADIVAHRPETMIQAILAWLDIRGSNPQPRKPTASSDWARRDIRDPVTNFLIMEFWSKVERQGDRSALLIKVKADPELLYEFLRSQQTSDEIKNNPVAGEIFDEILEQARAAAGVEKKPDPESN